ncbi:hypothetical protein F2P56_012882 [Juglans regia]|uniref:NAC domain-containing protein n=2 Tax=Juglans regia TaxID=51240 RepID=A0A834CYK7_JUGRE|nr:protein SOMBRERO-like isoform X2 [Juglans regia]KAF5468753.1 hypothetical protein F2P56_012882 [Juglans regia]
MMPRNGHELTVPPGFRFHPTEEELLYYYLRKKVSYEAIDHLDVIREVDLNKLEPWDLKERCRIGSGPQNEWYFFSHKDKKYPTGTRTNRATTAGFWKATGRAPHGRKTDWIMHEYRLDDDLHTAEVQEDGWVVCRIFEKKNNNRGFQPDQGAQDQEQYFTTNHMKASTSSAQVVIEPKQNHLQELYDYTFDHGRPLAHLPPLISPELAINAPFLMSPAGSLNTMQEVECSQNCLRLTAAAGCGLMQQERFINNGEYWSLLDKLLIASNQSLDQSKSNPS